MSQLSVRASKTESLPPWGGGLLLLAALVFHASVAGLLYLFSFRNVVARPPMAVEISFEADAPGVGSQGLPPSGGPPSPERPTPGKGTPGKREGAGRPSSRGGQDGGEDLVPRELNETPDGQTGTTNPPGIPAWQKWLPKIDPSVVARPLVPSGAGTDPMGLTNTSSGGDDVVRYRPDKHGNLVYTGKIIKVSINPQTGEVSVSSRAAGFIDAGWGKNEVRFAPGQIVEKLFGGDPYAGQKIKILDDPETKRVLQAVWAKVRAQRQYRARAEALALLQRIVQNNASWEQKKRAVFEYWLDLDQDPGEESPGSVARRAIDEFIREHFAQGGQGEFTTSDLEAMNKEAKRRGMMHGFHPYK